VISRRAPQVFRQRAVRQRLGQMQAADFFRAVEVGEGAGDAQHAMIAARRQPHGFGGVAQQPGALRVGLGDGLQHRRRRFIADKRLTASRLTGAPGSRGRVMVNVASLKKLLDQTRIS
jgi:hypothetical protein